MVSHPLRVRMMHLLVFKAYTGQQLAAEIELAASKVHYHLRELEQHGLVEVVATEEKNGIMQKFFRAVALDYLVLDTLLPGLGDTTEMLRENAASHLRSAISRVYAAPAPSFDYLLDQEGSLPLSMLSLEVLLPKEEMQKWLKRHQALIEELLAMEKQFAPSSQLLERFYMVNVGFLVADGFDVPDEPLPSGYEAVRAGVVRKTKRDGDKKS